MSANEPPKDLSSVDDFADLFSSPSDTPATAPGANDTPPVSEPVAAPADDPFADLFPNEDTSALTAEPGANEPAAAAPAPVEPEPAAEPEPEAQVAAEPEAQAQPAVAEPATQPVGAPEPEAPQVLQAQPAPAGDDAPPEWLAHLTNIIGGLQDNVDRLRGGLEHLDSKVDTLQANAGPAGPELAALPPVSATPAPAPASAEQQPVAEAPIAAPEPEPVYAPEPEPAPAPAAPVPVPAEYSLDAFLSEADANATAPAPEADTLEALFNQGADVPTPEPTPEPIAEAAVAERTDVADEEDAELARRLEAAREATRQQNAAAERRRALSDALGRLEAGEDLTEFDREILDANGVAVPAADPEPQVAPIPEPTYDHQPQGQYATEPTHDADAPVYAPEPGYVEEDHGADHGYVDRGDYDDRAPYDDRYDEPAGAGYDDAGDFSHLTGDDEAGGYADPSAGERPDFEAVDVLWAVGVRDTDAEEVLRSTHALDRMRKEARENSRKSKRGGGRVKLPRLPFSTVGNGDPLVIAVYSPKGGAGKSTTSVNLGALLAASGAATAGKDQAPPRVLVMDGDIANGNLAIRVANSLEPNLLELILWMDANGDLTEYDDPNAGASMRDFVLWHDDLPNLNILAAPENPEAFEDFEVADFERILNMVGRFYDVIIIDCGTEVVMHSNQTWLRHADQVFLLTLPERAALHSAGKAARVITRAGSGRPTLVSPDRLHIVMMRSDADLGFDPRHGVQATFDWADAEHVSFFRDYDQETARANNAGDFLSLANPDYAEDISALATAAFRHHQNNRRPTRR